MLFFVDTADIQEIRQAAKLGVLDGVTTNPSLMAKTGRPIREQIKEICKLCPGPVSCEVLSTDYEGMLQEAKELATYASNIVVKLPLTPEGIQTTKTCSELGIKTNLTLCFNASSALVAAKAGATYISPFVGRLDDIGHDGMQLIREIKTIYSNYQFRTQILVASIRHPLHLRDAALIGADVATIPFKLFAQLLHHPLGTEGLAKFLEDAKKIPRA